MSKQNENLEGSVGVEDNTEGVWYLTSESVVEMNTAVGDNLEVRSIGVGDNNLEGVGNLASKIFVEMNNDVGDNVEGTEVFNFRKICLRWIMVLVILIII